MKRKFFSILLALVLVLSLGLVTAAPAAAYEPITRNVIPFALGVGAYEGDPESIAEWTTNRSYQGSSSVLLVTTGGTVGITGDEARIVIDASVVGISTLSDLVSISWYEYLSYGYPPHVDVIIDTDGDEVADDALVFEYAYNDHIGEGQPTYGALTGEWYQTFGDDDLGPDSIDNNAYAWLTTGPAGGPDIVGGTLSEWKAGTVDASSLGKSVDGNTAVISFEIEVDNWLIRTEAYVDDIAINGVTYYGQIQDTVDSAFAGDTVSVAAGTYNEAEISAGDYTTSVQIDKALTLRGANADVNPVTETRGAESIIDAGGADRAINILSNLGVVTFDGFTVQNFANQGICHRFDVREGTTVHVLNNIVLAFPVSPAHGNSIQVSGDYSTVIGNDVTGASLQDPNWAGTAILVVAADNAVIRGNFVHDAEKGIAVVGYEPWGGTAINTLIELNTVQDSRYGITVDGDSQDTVIRYNDVLNNGLGQPDGSGIESQSYGAGITPMGTQIHFNNIVGNEPYGVVSYEWVDGIGPVIASPNSEEVDAACNWWGDISGPEHETTWGEFPTITTNPSGIGDSVSDYVYYIPWLTRDFQTVLDDNIAYFGIPMVHLNTGWNTFSTPIALDPLCATWGSYKELGDDLSLYDPDGEYVNAYYFLNNGEVQGFVEVDDNYRLRPCDAIYVRMAEPDTAAILFSPNVSISSKELYAGWNLVSFAPALLSEGNPPRYHGCLPASVVLQSVLWVPGDLHGYKLVVNPPVNWYRTIQEPWTQYWRDMGDGEAYMCPTLGYWVLMNNDGTLAGLSSTPIPLMPPDGPLQ